MADYKPVTEQNAEIFLKLYKKYLLLKLEDMKDILQELPTDVIDRCFNDVEFYKEDFDVSKINDTIFGFGGLNGYKNVVNVADNLIYCDNHLHQNDLIETLEKYGHKVNLKKIGVHKDKNKSV